MLYYAYLLDVAINKVWYFGSDINVNDLCAVKPFEMSIDLPLLVDDTYLKYIDLRIH